MPKEHDQIMEEKMDLVIGLLRTLVAVELSQKGVPVVTIGKRLRMKTGKVIELLKGVKKSK